MATWQEISADPRYQNADDAEKNRIRSAFQSQAQQPEQPQNQFAPRPEPTIRPVDYERGFMGDVGSAFGRGVTRAVGQFGAALSTLDLDPTDRGGLFDQWGADLQGWSDTKLATSEFLRPDISQAEGEGAVKRGLLGAVESLPSSFIPAAAGVAGAVVGGVPLGITAGVAALLGQFGLGTYGDKYQAGLSHLMSVNPDMTEDEARDEAHNYALKHAAFETGTELASNVVGLLSFGGGKALSQPLKATLKEVFIKDGLKAGLSRYGKQVGLKQIPTEVVGEMITAAGQTQADIDIGMDADTPWDAAKEAILPSVFMSLAMGSAYQGMADIAQNKVKRNLNNIEEPETRKIAAFQTAKLIEAKTGDKDIAQGWLQEAQNYIRLDQEIPVDTQMEQFAQAKIQDEKDENRLAVRVGKLRNKNLSATQLATIRNNEQALEQEGVTTEAVDRLIVEKFTGTPVETAAKTALAANMNPSFFAGLEDGMTEYTPTIGEAPRMGPTSQLERHTPNTEQQTADEQAVPEVPEVSTDPVEQTLEETYHEAQVKGETATAMQDILREKYGDNIIDRIDDYRMMKAVDPDRATNPVTQEELDAYEDFNRESLEASQQSTWKGSVDYLSTLSTNEIEAKIQTTRDALEAKYGPEIHNRIDDYLVSEATGRGDVPRPVTEAELQRLDNLDQANMISGLNERKQAIVNSIFADEEQAALESREAVDQARINNPKPLTQEEAENSLDEIVEVPESLDNFRKFAGTHYQTLYKYFTGDHRRFWIKEVDGKLYADTISPVNKDALAKLEGLSNAIAMSQGLEPISFERVETTDKRPDARTVQVEDLEVNINDDAWLKEANRQYSRLKETARMVVGQGKMKLIDSLLKARAASAGMTVQQYVGLRGLQIQRRRDTEGNKGAFNLEETGWTISAFQKADISTLAHELGHMFRRDLEVVADQQLMKDAEQWAGVENGKWTVAAEEKFARGFEKYLRDGEAPNEGLARIFEGFKRWLTNIYQTITGTDLDLEISPQIKNVFDSLLNERAALSRERETIQDINASAQNEALTPEEQAEIQDELNGDITPDGDMQSMYPLFQPAWHGTPKKGIDKFSTKHIGEGEGAQAYGWGMYFASKKEIAETYRKNLAGNYEYEVGGKTIAEWAKTNPDKAEAIESVINFGYDPIHSTLWDDNVPFSKEHFDHGYKQLSDVLKEDIDMMEIELEEGDYYDEKMLRNTLKSYKRQLAELNKLKISDFKKKKAGQVYKVEVPEDSELLFYDKPFSEQSEKVQKLLRKAKEETGATFTEQAKGRSIYDLLGRALDTGDMFASGRDKAASQYLKSLGVKGIKYLDGFSRDGGKGSHNYVIFEDGDVDIVDTLYQKAVDRAVDNPNFEEWFGDSKIVDSEGKPLVVFHGTKRNFRQFKSGYDNGLIFFTINPEFASSWIKGTGGLRDIEPETKQYISGIRKVEKEAFAKYNREYDYDDPNWADQYDADRAKSKAETKRKTGFESWVEFESVADSKIHPVFLSIQKPFNPETDYKEIESFLKTLPNGMDQLVAEGRHKRGNWIIYENEAVVEELRKRGYDGLILAENLDGPHETIAAFEDTQIKSVFNTGEWSSYDPDTLYQAAQANSNPTNLHNNVANNNTWGVPQTDTLWNTLKYHIVDKLNPLKRIQDKMGPLPDSMNVYRKESLRVAKSEAMNQNFRRDYVQPIIDKLKKYNIKLEDLEDLMYANHAPEANERLTRINAKRYLERLARIKQGKAGDQLRADINDLEIKAEQSGLEQHEIQDDYLKLLESNFNPNDSAQAALLKDWQEFKEKPSGMTNDEARKIRTRYAGNKRMNDLAYEAQQLTEQKVDLLLNAGILSKEEAAKWRSYSSYIPLRREGFEDDRIPVGAGLSSMAKASHIRKGSTRRATNIFANIIADFEQASTRAGKAESGKALYELVNAFPNPEFWSVNQAQEKPYYDADGNIMMYHSHDVGKNSIPVRVDGRQYTIEFKDGNDTGQRIAKALKNDVYNHGPIVDGLSTVTRIMAMMNTTLSPEFVVSNFFRDIQTAMYNMSDTDIANMQKAVAGDVRNSMKGINAAIKGDLNSDWSKIYEDYRKHGGKVSWMSGYDTPRKQAEQIQKEIDMLTQGDIKNISKKNIKKMFDLIDRYNTVVENSVRVSFYKHAVDSGKMTKEQAAEAAKDLTTNFERKGASGQALNALYMFANAGIQGNARIIRALSKSSKARKMVGATIAMAAMVDIANRAMSDEDENGRKRYDTIPDYIKERNMVFAIPGSDKTVKIPLPWGYNVFWNIGTQVGRLFSDPNFKPSESAGSIVMSSLNAFNPLQAATMLQTMTPTIMDPFAQIAENKTAFGTPLMPEQMPGKYRDPNYKLHWSSAREPSKWVAKALNSIDGNSSKAGTINISPEWVDALYDTAMGSVGRFFADGLGVPKRLMTDEALEIKDVPFARRFLSGPSEYVAPTLYHETKEAVHELEAQLKDDQVPKGTKKELRQDPLYKMIARTKTTESQLRRLRKRKRAAFDDPERVAEIEALIQRTYEKYNSKYSSLVSM